MSVMAVCYAYEEPRAKGIPRWILAEMGNVTDYYCRVDGDVDYYTDRTGLPREQVEAAIQHLLDQGVLEPDPKSGKFFITHPLVGHDMSMVNAHFKNGRRR
jgi:hypothetical protein